MSDPQSPSVPGEAAPESSDRAKLARGSIAGHLWTQSAPMMLGIAALMSVGIIDAYFVGQIGAPELAAISFIFPITVALSSLGVGVMVGINSVLSRALGRGDDDMAEQRAVAGVVLAVITGVGIGLALYAIKYPLFRLMNAQDDVLPLIDAYMTPFALGFPVLIASQGLNGVLRAQGAAVRSSSILWVIAVSNWILDPLLIAGWGPFPAYGVAGAAYASVGAFFLSGVMGLILVQTSELRLHIDRFRWREWKVAARELVSVGGPAALSNSVNPMGLSILTAFLATYGQDQVAGFGAAGRLQSFAVVPLLALSSSIGSIVGQNWGAERYDRAWRALKYAFLFSLVYGLLTAALLVAFREPLGGLFTKDAAVLDAIGQYLSIAAWGYAGYGMLIVANGALNAIGRAPIATAMSFARVFLVMVPVAWIGRNMLNGGTAWIYSGELSANLVGGAAAFAIGWWLLRVRKAD